MKRFYFISGMFVLCLLFPAEYAFSQVREGTIEHSWKRAAQEVRTTPPAHRYVAPHPRQVEQQRATAWDAARSPETRPWPMLPPDPGPKDYHAVNTAVIDSLSQLYCLSPGYVTTLRVRNDEAYHGAPAGREREFSYTQSGPPAAREANRPSLQALYKELLQLLDRCLVGR
jgi:hypothetical protein